MACINACQNSIPFLFADDGALYFNDIKRGSYNNIKNEMTYIYRWLRINLLCLNIDKTSIIIFDSNKIMDTIEINVGLNITLEIKECKTHKYLGLMVDHKLKFWDHIDYVKSKIAKRIGAMYR